MALIIAHRFLYLSYMKNIDTDAIIRDIIQRYEQYGHEGSEVIQRAYEYARKAHEKHTRKS